MARNLFLFFVFAITAGLANAETIDGSWCASDGRSFTINGPKVLAPTGDNLVGEYDRHVFRYIGQLGSVEEAHDIRMFLWSEGELHLQRIVDGVEQPAETWRRCKRASAR